MDDLGPGASSWEEYRLLADNSLDVVMEADPTTTFTWVSPSVADVLGWSAEDVVGLTAADLVHPDDLAGVREHAGRMNEITSPDQVDDALRYDQIRMRTPSGTYKALSFRARPVLDNDGAIRNHIITLRDTSDRDEALRALSVLTEANRVIAFATEEGDLLAAMCEAIVKTGGYPLAWYGAPVDDEERSVTVRAAAGSQAEYARGLRVSWADRDEGRGPTGTCLREQQTQVVSDFTTDERFAPWRQRAHDHGMRSSISLPIMSAGTLCGSLSVYAHEPHAFDTRSRLLLETLASDLGLGLERLRATRRIEEQARELADSEQRYRLLAENSTDVVWQAPPGGGPEWVSESVRTVLGWEPEEFVHQSGDLVHPDDLAAFETDRRGLDRGMEAVGEARMACADGSWKWMAYEVRRAEGPKGPIDVLAMRDIDNEVQVRSDLAFALGHDPLTGMPTRTAIVDMIGQALATAPTGHVVAILCIGVDRLSDINAALTHSAGDLVISSIATRVVEATGTPHLIGRGAGVEFLAIVPGLKSSDAAVAVAERVREAARAPVHIGDNRVDPTVSIGIAVGRLDDDPEQLVRDASAAMGRAKADGRDRAAFADPSLADQARERLDRENRINHGLANGDFLVHLQPVVDLATRQLTGYEALIRLREPDGTIAGPDAFMPVAELSALVCDIDILAVRGGLAALGRLPENLTVGVNLSASTLARPGYLREVERLIAQSGVRPARMHLEVTETSLLGDNLGVVEGMSSLARLGIRWYVDDFGTGYSSISHIRDLPISGLKLDVSFSRGVREGVEKSVRLAQALAGLAGGLGLDTVAEGIESEAEERVLLAQGWRHGQGYLYGRPQPLP